MPGTIDKYTKAEEFCLKHKDVDLSPLFSEEERLLNDFHEKHWRRTKRDILKDAYWGFCGMQSPYIETITSDQWKQYCAFTYSLYPEQFKIYPDEILSIQSIDAVYRYSMLKNCLLKVVMLIPFERLAEVWIKAKSFFEKEPIPYISLATAYHRVNILDRVTRIPPEQWDELLYDVSPLFNEDMQGQYKTGILFMIQHSVSHKKLKEVCDFIGSLFTERMDGNDRHNIIEAAINFNREGWKRTCNQIRETTSIDIMDVKTQWEECRVSEATIENYILVATAIGEMIDKFRKEEQ